MDVALRAVFAPLYGILMLAIYGLAWLREDSTPMRYSPLANEIAFVPVFFLFALPIELLLLPKRQELCYLHAALQLLPVLFVFTLLTLALSPWLRKKYTAQSCADLWILPGMMTHIFIALWRAGTDPWLTVRLPRSVFRLLLGLWLVGFCAVMTWKTVGHFRFRRKILRTAKAAPVCEVAFLREVWNELEPDQRRNRLRPKLLRSPAVSAPLTIGLFSGTTRMVLPLREYSREELYLIFRHESIHLLHRDNTIKFSTVFLCAAGWFIPSLWLVMKRASEDLELCCDQIATADLNELGQGKYARLLLDNAGTETGFTTCLSASAKGLRNRLRRIGQPDRGKSAVLLVVLLTTLFVFFYGTVGLELDVGTVQTEFLDRESGSWHVVSLRTGAYGEACRDPQLLMAAEDSLRQLRLAKPLWVEWVRSEQYYPDGIYVTLGDGSGKEATLCIDGDRLYLRRDDTSPTPEYRVIGEFDPTRLQKLADTAGGR